MSRVFLGVFSCHRYIYTAPNRRDWFSRPNVDRVSALRDTWLKDVTFDYKIIKGVPPAGQKPQPDELFLGVNDDYHHSADKLRALIRYTLDNGYDYLLKIDDDVFVYWDRLLQNIPTGDYVGGGPFGSTVIPDCYCSGMTYWLSRRAMESLMSSPGKCWAEDRWCGEALIRKGIRATFDLRYYIAPPTRTCQYISDEALEKSNDYITIHSMSPDQMRRYYERRKAMPQL